MPLVNLPYNRTAALEYASWWAFSRNPRYYNFDSLGGDCTNFASQCLFAGSKVMNYTPLFGWYFISANNKSPSWTGVPYFYNFLINNKNIGPHATDSNIYEIQEGDFLQLGNDNGYYHTLIIVRIDGVPSDNSIYLASHTEDSYGRVLRSYYYSKIRFLHINGVRR